MAAFRLTIHAIKLNKHLSISKNSFNSSISFGDGDQGIFSQPRISNDIESQMASS